MFQSFITSVKNGIVKIKPNRELPVSTKVLATILSEEDFDNEFWMKVSEEPLARIWDNEEDNIYQK